MRIHSENIVSLANQYWIKYRWLDSTFFFNTTGRPRKKLVSELLNSIKGALLCWMFKFSNALLCWMIGRWWLWRFWMTNFVLPKNGQKMPKCENVKFWIPSQWHSDCVQNFWGRPKSKIGRPVPFWKFQILGCWWWRELLSCVG